MARPRQVNGRRKSRRLEQSKIKEDIQSTLTTSSVVAKRLSKSALRPAGYTHGASTLDRDCSGSHRPSHDWSIEIATPRLSIASSSSSVSLLDSIVQQSEDELTSRLMQEAEQDWMTSREFTMPIDDPVARLTRTRDTQKLSVTTMNRLLGLQTPLSIELRDDADGDIWHCRIGDCTFVQRHASTAYGQDAVTEHYNGHAQATSEALQLIATMGQVKTNALLEKLQDEAKNWSMAMESDTRLLSVE